MEETSAVSIGFFAIDLNGVSGEVEEMGEGVESVIVADRGLMPITSFLLARFLWAVDIEGCKMARNLLQGNSGSVADSE